MVHIHRRIARAYDGEMSIREFKVKVVVPAPVQEVWNELVTWQNQGNWMALTQVSSSQIGPEDSGVGTAIDAFTGIGKIGVIDRMRIVEWQPPYFCKVDHYGKIIKGIGTFTLSNKNGATVFDWYEEIQAPRAVLVFIKPFILIAVYVSLRKFARTFTPR